MDVKEDENVCIVCWRDIHVYAVGLCDHPVCHECSTRMRVLCRKSECPICRRNLPKVIFVKECRPFEELNKRLYQVDVKPQICFGDESVRQAYRALLENRCKYCPPPAAEGKPAPSFSTFGMLRNHVRKEHNRTYCDLCIEHLKIFPSERTAYTRRDMVRHQSQGDVEDTSHRGHPLCKFCAVRYFDNDELYRHLRREHYHCHFCGDNYRLQYYRDYTVLREHFRDAHFLCEEGDCRNETFTAAFRTEIDLKAHRAQQHNRSLTKAQAKLARTLDLEFAVAPRASANTHASGVYYDESGSHGRRALRQQRSGRDDLTGRNPPLRPPAEQHSLNLTWEVQPPVDYRCEKEFPQLGNDAGASSSGAAKAADQFPVAASSYPPRKPEKVNVDSVDEFPSLNPSATAQATAPQTSTMVSLRKLAKTQANGIPPGRGLGGKQQDYSSNSATGGKSGAKGQVQASGDRSMTKQQPTISAVVSARPTDTVAARPPPASKAPPKVALEEEFPTLATRTIARISVAPAPTPPPQSEPPWSTAKTKTKKKKKAEETKQPDTSQRSLPTAEVNNNNGTTSNGSTKAARDAAKQGSETPAVQPPATAPTDNLLQLIAAARRGTTKPAHPVPITGAASDGDSSDSDNSGPTPMLTVADFPCLNGMSGVTPAPPPGFGKPKPPPGFVRPAGSDTTVGLSLASVTAATTPSPMPPEYREPAGFQLRNLKLIQDVQQILARRTEGDLFAKFKSLSGSFRQNTLTADEYFARCIEVFGSEKDFFTIFPELLFLLPDIRKQQELMATFNAHRRAQAATSGALPKGCSVQLLVCATCQQVLSAEDFRSHRTLHDPS
ncbi:hypothetical protein V5799_006018 [Amblyomma americanum]|uniref:RING-type E3 ubiquitin transferase n=1 Tax=Amblyomma americanum TaxID=6943 RepID=A0AAQ4DXK7_AMBAM